MMYLAIYLQLCHVTENSMSRHHCLNMLHDTILQTFGKARTPVNVDYP